MYGAVSTNFGKENGINVYCLALQYIFHAIPVVIVSTMNVEPVHLDIPFLMLQLAIVICLLLTLSSLMM